MYGGVPRSAAPYFVVCQTRGEKSPATREKRGAHSGGKLVAASQSVSQVVEAALPHSSLSLRDVRLCVASR